MAMRFPSTECETFKTAGPLLVAKVIPWLSTTSPAGQYVFSQKYAEAPIGGVAFFLVRGLQVGMVFRPLPLGQFYRAADEAEGSAQAP
jgi:hypothetical protein